jgi:hypothetical protein
MAAEKIIPIIIDVKPDPALVKNLAQIKTNISAIDVEISNLGKQSKAAIKQGATKDAQGLNEEIIRLSQARKELKDTEKDLQKQIDNTGKAFKSSLAEAGSYNQLSSRLTVLINQYKTLGDTKTPSAKALLGEINSIQDQLTETDTELRNFKSNVGNYEKAILQALKNAGDEKGLKKQTDEIKKRNEELKSQAANLAKQYEDTFKKTGKLAEEARTKIGQQLTKINDDIAKNEKTLEQFQKGGITAKQGGKVAKTGARLLGQKAIGGLATGVVESAGALGSLGPAGIAAFGVFAAGGLVFKGVQALEQLAAGINKTTAEVQRLSGASVEEAKGLTDEVRTLAVAFGENEDAVLENVKSLQEGLGISFTEALAQVKDGYISTAQAGGVLNSTVQNQLDSSAALVAVQRELADRFTATGASTGTLVTDIKTGLLTALITVFDAIKPVVDSFINFGKALFGLGGTIGKVTGGASVFGKVLKATFVPLRIAGVIISKAAEFLANLANKLAEFINDSPNIQAAFQVIGDAVGKFLDFIIAIPDAIETSINAIADFARDAASLITGGLVDDAATAAAAANARDAGQTISEELVKRYGEGVKQLSTETQIAVAQAAAAAAQAAIDNGASLQDAATAAAQAADRVAKANGLKVQKRDKELTNAQLQSRLDAAEKAKAAREKAAGELLKEIEDLNKKQIDTEKDFTQTLSEARKQRAEESISFIQNDYERQSAEIDSQAAAQVEQITQTLTEASEAAQSVLKAKAAILERDPNQAKALGFSSIAEIQEAAAQTQQAVEAEITAQTGQIQRKRTEQLAALKTSREKLIAETLRNIDNEALSRAVEQQGLQQTITANEIAAQKAAGSQKIAQAEAEFTEISALLAIQRDANIITEKEYTEKVGVLERSLAIAKLDIERETQAQINQLQQKALQDELANLQLQGEQQQRAAEERRAQSVADIQAQAQQGILTQQQAADAIAQINADAEAAKVANAQIINQEIAAANAEFTNNEIAQAQSQAEQELAIQRSLQEAIRAERQATFDQLNQNVQNLNTAFTTSVGIANDLFEASNNRRTQAIEAQFAREVQLANGNQSAIVAAEERKDAALQAIEKAAFERKKRLDTAQALINGALAITNILATTPDPTGLFTAIRIGAAIATTAAQIVKIQSQQFELGGLIESGGKIPKRGGKITGRRHSSGGVKFLAGGQLMEAEGGEAIMTRGAVQKFGGLLSILNQAGGGQPFELGGIVGAAPKKWVSGGVLNNSNLNSIPVLSTKNAENLQINSLLAVIQQSNANLVASIDSRFDRLTVVNNPIETIKQGVKQGAREKLTTL